MRRRHPARPIGPLRAFDTTVTKASAWGAVTEKEVVSLMADVTSSSSGRDRRWLVLGVIGLAQLMVVLDITVMNIALPSAQRALGFTTVDRQWVVTAYTLAFGSLLLLGGRLADLLGRKVTFLAGLAGFAVVSAVGGASVNFAMLITARACQGAFAALLVPSALSLLTTTFTAPKDRAKAFGIYGAIAGAGGAIGLLLGGALTEYLSWRWTLYVNLIFAGVAFTGGLILLKRQPSPVKPRLDIPGVVLVSGAVFCLVYGFSNAATNSWHTPSTWGFLAAGVVLGVAFAAWQTRAAHPLLPPRVVLDRNRGGAYASMLIGTAGLFGTFLFLTYYLQQTLGYSPLVTGFAFLPMSVGLIVAANLATIVLMPRTGPKPLIASGMLAAAAGTAWLAQLGPHTGYATGLLGPLILAGVGLGMVIAPAINTGTFGVAPQDAGVASATVTVSQMLGGSVGTSLLNTIFAGAVTSYLAAHLATAQLIGRQALTGLALAHGYDTAFWWTAGIFACGAVVSGALLRPGPLVPTDTPSRAQAEVPTAQAETGTVLVTAPRANRLIDLRGFLIHYPVLASARSWAVRTATIMADRCTGVRSASIGSTQSPALPRYPSVATVVEQ
jgi:EmrB/QacA subfamily drug resistance transporter